ncbi:hypothetical protein, partial [Streptomyces sp. NPDC091268]|uniref:hypothetical protein n=1 Tax=Streptomyces sp. NPDC091268 TaxID=3365979 RepID=UPI0037F4ABC6
LIFGTLLSSQGTDASFVLTLSGFPPGFSFVFLRSCVSDSIRPGPARFPGSSLSRFPFPAIPTLSVLFRLSDHSPFAGKSAQQRMEIQDP